MFICRKQPWSTYAVHLTTLAPPAIVGDALLLWFLWLGTADWPAEQARNAMVAMAAWMTFTKFIKLITHFVRYPIDILLWPVSILFGWFHGAIKYYALATLSEVSDSGFVVAELVMTDKSISQTTWGSRAGADADDSDRMIKQTKTNELFDFRDEKFSEKLPLQSDMKAYTAYDLKRSQALPA